MNDIVKRLKEYGSVARFLFATAVGGASSAVAVQFVPSAKMRLWMLAGGVLFAMVGYLATTILWASAPKTKQMSKTRWSVGLIVISVIGLGALLVFLNPDFARANDWANSVNGFLQNSTPLPNFAALLLTGLMTYCLAAIVALFGLKKK